MVMTVTCSMYIYMYMYMQLLNEHFNNDQIELSEINTEQVCTSIHITMYKLH